MTAHSLPDTLRHAGAPRRPAVDEPPAAVSPDADSRWLGTSVDFIGRCIIAGLALVLVRDPVLGLAQPPGTALVIGCGMLVAGGALWLNRRGLFRPAAQALAFSLPLLAALLCLNSGRGFHDPAILMLPASLILCGVLLDRKALAVTTVLAVSATAGVLLAEWRGLLQPPAGSANLAGDLVDSVVILAVTGIGVGMVGGRLRRGIERLRRQEAALRASEARYRGLVDLAADAILLGTPEGRIAEANRRASELTGYASEELLGQPLEQLFSPEERRRVPFQYEAISRGETRVVERLLTRKDGSTVPVEMSSKRMPDGTHQSILRDVSERHRAEAERLSLEARLRQAQKMEAVGRLAGGIAHDFNNLLTTITGSLTLALRDVPADSAARRWLTEVDKSSWRAAALTRRLLAFSRQQVIEPRVIDLRQVVEGTGSLVARTIGEDVRLRVRTCDEPCRVEVDQGQLEQVILNLVTNARDAMPDGGLLTLEVGWATPAQILSTARHPREDRRVAVLVVSDTGHGMPDEVKARIFEPFFTTKPSGTGTGLGLAMVYGAVEQNGGWIEVESAPGRGSAFRIFLEEARAEAAAAAGKGPEEAQRGTETVLLVEDEQAVREVTAEQLEALGYRVLACAGGQEALAVAAGHGGPLHLLLTDIVMPGMNGRQLAARLTEARTGLRVLYTSGYGEDVIARHGVVEKGVQLLQKPYSLQALARHVRRALAA